MHPINEVAENYLLHRLGYSSDLSRIPKYCRRSLDGNSDFINFKDTYGKSIINGYVCFIDLKGFSSYSAGKDPNEICKYVLPFLNTIIEIVKDTKCLIDKCIGDEIMFIIPDSEESEVVPAIFELSQIFYSIREYAYSSCNSYSFRIGLSHGALQLVRIGNERYNEFTFFGEPIHVAKRLMNINELANPRPVLLAFGLNKADSKVDTHLIHSYLNTWEKIIENERILKGVGNVKYIVLN